MFANILRIIFFLLLTAAVQQIGLEFLDASDSEHGGLRIILCVPLLALAYWQWHKIGAFKRRAWMAENPAPFNPDMIDCYVRFTGKVTEERPCRLPLSGSECVYYAALVVGERQVKKKKPSKGMETVRKPLLREQSAEALELTDKDTLVYVKAEEFTKSCLGLRSKESAQAHCPPQVKEQEKSKCKKYHLTEHFLLHGDSVTAQGRLALNRDGRLFIKPTRRLEFPSFLVVQKKASQFILDTAEKALHDAWSKRINVVFLLLNAGLFIYFW
jgi:hypothetical protein